MRLAASLVNVDNKNSVFYDVGGNYNINGGTLNVNLTAGLFNTSVNGSATASVSNAGGEIDINVDSSIFSGFSGDKTYTLNITNSVPKNFQIKFNLTPPSWVVVGAIFTSASALYDGKNTTVTASVTGGGVVFYSTATVKIVIPGNPYNLLIYFPTTIPLSAGAGQVCYLEGTSIKTPTGYVKIENLSEGDAVCVHASGAERVEAITWIGQRWVEANIDEQKPVKIKKSALAEAVPFADLLITQEHCLYLEGCLVPARMLVNGGSIVLEDLPIFSIYHIETQNHSLIIANGVLSESYLDTGNRDSFEHLAGSTLAVRSKRGPSKSWEEDAVAPLGVSRAFVEPLFNKFANRAIELGFAREASPKLVTYDPDIRVFADGGAPIEFLRRCGTRWLFKLPAHVERIWLTSRADAPSDSIGPFVDDQRQLGVLVGQIHLFREADTVMINHHLKQSACLGWQEREDEDRRWTSGVAEINLDQSQSLNPALLSIEVISSGPYRCGIVNMANAAGMV